MTNTNEDQE